jgi:formylglycine-generating enzyme required for sulfatase activity
MKKKFSGVAVIISALLLAFASSLMLATDHGVWQDEDIATVSGQSANNDTPELLVNGDFPRGSAKGWIVAPGGQFILGNYQFNYYRRLSGEIGQNLDGKLAANKPYRLRVGIKNIGVATLVQAIIATTVDGRRKFYYAPTQLIPVYTGPSHNPYQGMQYCTFDMHVIQVGTDTRIWFHTLPGSPTGPTLIVDYFSLKEIILISPNIGALIYVPAGTFQRDDIPINTSSVSSFFMSAKEITGAQYTAVTGQINPSYFPSVSNGPLEMVNWYHALVFCNKLSLLEGLTPVYKVFGVTDPDIWGPVPTTSADISWNLASANWSANGYRLPTEMEWQWAAMGAIDNRWKAFAGSTGENLIEDYVWYGRNSMATTHPVGTKLPNELGLYDMSGNVCEWCWDWSGLYPQGPLMDYKGAAPGTTHVVRSGCWEYLEWGVTVTNSLHGEPYYYSRDIGFRVVRR